MSDPEQGSSKVESSRETKRRKQRETLNASFGDPLLKVSLPDIVRKHSAEVDKGAIEFEERVRSLSAKSNEVVEAGNEEQAREYVTSRKKLANDGAFWLKKSKNIVETLRRENILDRPTAKRAHKELDECDKALLQERAALAANRVKVQYGILSHTSHARIGEAYLAAIVESLPEPAGAQIKKQGARDRSDQTSFRNRVLAAYNPPGTDSDPDNVESWCPVSKRLFMEQNVIAAHIVPYSIGEVNAAYLFGLDPEAGYEAIWSVKNGMSLHHNVEKALDAARIIIVQDEDDVSELKLIVLDETLLNKKMFEDGPRFRDVNHQRLEFRTTARPGRRFLYLHYLLTLFRRKRFNVDGWEDDQKKITNTYLWGTPGPWLRRSIIKALAFEVGDAEKLEDVIGNQDAFTEFPNELSEEKESNMVVGMTYNLESIME